MHYDDNLLRSAIRTKTPAYELWFSFTSPENKQGFLDLVRQDGYSNPNEPATLKTPQLSRGAKGEMGTGESWKEDGLTVPIPARNYLLTAYEHFARIARETSPAQFIGAGGRTRLTKDIDNAVVGFCRVERLPTRAVGIRTGSEPPDCPQKISTVSR
jgi:hypothetical protein